MAHMIESAAYARKPAWHGLGTVYPNYIEPNHILEYAGLNWRVNQEEMYLANGTRIEKYRANVRDKDGAVLGVRSEDYSIMQNEESLQFLLDLLECDEQIKFEAAGSLAGGRRIWFLAHLPRMLILGDEFDPYIVLGNSFDGSSAFKAAMTPIRVVCQNTYTAAFNGTKRSWSVRHTGDLNRKREEASVTLQLANRYMQKLNERAEIWQQFKMSKNNIIDVICEVIPEKPEMTSRMIRQLDEQRDEVLMRWQARDNEQFRDCAWGVMNAFTDYATHSKPARMTATFQEKRFASFIDGNDLLDTVQKVIEKRIAA